MQPKDFRHIRLNPGTLLGVLGEEKQTRLIKGVLKSYVIVERHDSDQQTPVWDTALIMSLSVPLQTLVGVEKHQCNELLLIHRYPDFAWDNMDPVVYVVGMREGESLGEGPVSCYNWLSKSFWLETHATMIVEDPSAPSEIARLLQEQAEAKKDQERGP
jgi:hypothetical protein